MLFQTIYDVLEGVKSRFNMKSEISAQQKEGQDCFQINFQQLDVLKEEYKEVLSALKKLHEQYHDMLENAPTDYEEILIYERYVSDLLSVIYELVLELNCKDRRKPPLDYKSETLSSASTGIDLKNENRKDTAIVAMDLTDERIHVSMVDNKIEMNGDVRHHYNTNDLQTMCDQKHQILSREAKNLKIENETIKKELKRTLSEKETSFHEFSDVPIKAESDEHAKQRISDLEEKLEKQLRRSVELETNNKNLQEEISSKDKKIKEIKKDLKKNVQKFNTSDMRALVHEIADKHDCIAHLRAKITKLEEKLEQYERKVQFREKIIRELRRQKSQQQNTSPLMMTPPRTPELKQSHSSADLIENNIVYRNNYLTVPAHNINNIEKGDSMHSLSDIDQDSIGKSISETNFDCYECINKDEMDGLQQKLADVESENNCLRLMITKLEDDLILIRKCESRTKQDRNLKKDKLNVLKHKIKKIESSVLEKNSEKVDEPKLHQNDLVMIEDELKPELDALNKLVKLVNTTKTNLERTTKENVELKDTVESLKAKIIEAQQNSQNLISMEKQQIQKKLTLPENHQNCILDIQRDIKAIKYCDRNILAEILSHLLGKDISEETIGVLSGGSSSPEISSGTSSLSNGHSSLSDVINEWKHELEEKKCELKSKTTKINDLEERLRIKDEEVSELQNDLKSVQTERDKNCQMVNQLKNAIQYHNESIHYLKKQNAELSHELGEARSKFANHRDYYDEMNKRNIELDDENKNMRKTISTMRTTIEDLKRGSSMQTNDIEAANTLNEQFLKETIQKDEQLNRLREANLQLRSQIFELNQDILDLMEIVDIQKNKRALETFKIAQKEQQQQIEKEISNREKDINCLKHYRSRCIEIEAEYLDKMASQKLKSDTTIKELGSEITALTEQLIQSHQQNTHYDELMKQTAIFQNSMQDLERQNDVLRKTIESYESRFGELQVNLEKIQFENGSLLMEIENLKSDICDKNKRISEISFEHQRLETENEMQKKSCTCSNKNSPTRTSSTVMQINDLKTKLMNKSLESSKATEALKRKTLQYEKAQKTAFEEKAKLREECLKSIQTIGELKSKVSLLEMRVKEQNDEVSTSRDKLNQNIARLTAIESELESKSAKLDDLTAREEKWRIHAYEITHEIKNRKEDAFKREQKLMDEIAAKAEQMKDQTRIILQHENSLHHLRNENEALRESNATLNQRLNDLKADTDELKLKEKGLTELLDKTEEELKMIKSEVFQLFNTNAVSDIKNVHGQMVTETEDLQTKYQDLLVNYNKLVEENRTLYEMKNDTISAIELFKKLQDENVAREKSYKIQIEKLLNDKRNLHKDRTRLTKQLLSKHRDMIILNSEIDKFRNSDDYEGRSSSQYSSLQAFQPVMYPSAIAPLARSTSNPDLIGDPVSLDVRNITEKLGRVRKFWQHGIQTAVTSLVNVQQSEAQQQIQTPNNEKTNLMS